VIPAVERIQETSTRKQTRKMSGNLADLSAQIDSMDGDLRKLLGDVSNEQGVFGARLCVFVCSAFLIAFYLFQFSNGRCNAHPIYVQSVTLIVYALAAFGDTNYLFTTIENSQGEKVQLALGRYLFWIMTCPVIISNVNTLLNIFTPDDIDLPKITFMMCKDIILMCFGILGAVQTSESLKWTFIVFSFLVGGWLLRDIFRTMFRKKSFFTPYERCWEWIILVMTVFLFSWGVFPVLYMIGPPALNLTSPEADKIGHACGDLFAKNFFGFTCWYVRYVVLDEHVKNFKNSRAVTPYGSVPKHVIYGGGSQRKRKPMLGRKHLHVIVVEQKIELQRLFTLMMQEAGVICHFAFDLKMAARMLKREHLGTFTAVLIDLDVAKESRVLTQRFRVNFRKKPYYVPVLGYSFSAGPIAEKDDSLCDGVINHVLDESHIAELVEHWGHASEHWKELDATAEMERKLYNHTQGMRTSSQEEDDSFFDEDEADRQSYIPPPHTPTQYDDGYSPQEEYEFNSYQYRQQPPPSPYSSGAGARVRSANIEEFQEPSETHFQRQRTRSFDNQPLRRQQHSRSPSPAPPRRMSRGEVQSQYHQQPRRLSYIPN